MDLHSKLIFFILFTLTCHFVNAQSHNDELPELSQSIYSDLANGCRNYKNMRYLIAGTFGLMLEDEVQSKISLIRSCNKEVTYKLLNALYEIQPDLFKENLYYIGFPITECKECENAILALKGKELDKVKAKEKYIFDKWMNEGVPDDVKPNVNATLKYSGITKTATFIESLDDNEKINYTLKLRIKDDCSISIANLDSEELMDSTFLFSLFSFDKLSVEQPAYYNFKNTTKKIPMSSIENISILEERKSITHDEPYDAPKQYQSGDFDSFKLIVNNNLNKNTIKIVKNEADEISFDIFCKKYNFDKTNFINNDIKKYLSSRGYNGKISIICQARKRKVVVRHDGELLAEKEIKPKLIIYCASYK